MEPFGMGNPTPVFVARGLHLAAAPQMVGKNHLKLKVGKGSKLFDALGWNQGGRPELPEAGESLDLAFTLDENYYRGIASLQLIIKDLRASPEGSG